MSCTSGFQIAMQRAQEAPTSSLPLGSLKSLPGWEVPALSYVGSVTSQTLSTTSSRALIKSEVETSLSNYTGTTKPQIYTEVTFYPKGVEGLNV